MFGIRMLAGILGLSIVLNGAAGFAHKTLLQQGIAEEVLRFHVLANSDSEEDQEVKLKVRDAVLKWAEKILEYEELIENKETDRDSDMNVNDQIKNEAKDNSEDVTQNTTMWDTDEESRNRSVGMKNKKVMQDFLKQHLGEVENLAERVLQENGYSYEASADIQSSYFPDRTYRDCTFPAGWYDALRIELGEAKGQNWWCVFYPRLCFADYLHVVSDQKSTGDRKNSKNDMLEQILTVEEYELLLQKPGEWKIGFRWF